LSQNEDLLTPAPLSLCSVRMFDLAQDHAFCPVERNALAEFYDKAKGREWSRAEGWIKPYTPHCSWHGVSCDESETVLKLALRNGGLSGGLSPSISKLANLVHLDLSDNDIMGTVPSEIGELQQLTYLRLAYNSFQESLPSSMSHLTKLKLLQFQSNRISGDVPHIYSTHLENDDKGGSDLVSDCGSPSIFRNQLDCTQCTICCNADGACIANTDTPIQEAGFDTYKEFTWVFFVAVILFCCGVWFFSVLVDKYKRSHTNLSQSRALRRTQSSILEDRKYAMDSSGESVYSFFLGTSIAGWMIALSTFGIQIWFLYFFVNGAEYDPSDDNSELEYTMQCTKDQDDCVDKNDLSPLGWVAFVILMAANILTDVINGVKLLIISGKNRHSRHTRLRFFFGGLFLNVVTLFTIFASVIYNQAIATSNIAIIENSVIILFITDIDELLHSIISTINANWVDQFSLRDKSEDEPQDELAEKRDDEIAPQSAGVLESDIGFTGVATDELNKVKKDVVTLFGNFEKLQAENVKMKKEWTKLNEMW